MDRRAFIVGGVAVLAAPLAGEAQTGKVPKVGYVVGPLPPECKVTPFGEAFLRGLQDLGYVLGQTITVDRRCYVTNDQLRKTLSEFVRLKVDVILVGSPAQALAARAVSKSIPIVCGSCGDPVDNGLVASLARPGGSVTGLASLSAERIAKRVELLKETLPDLSRVAVLLYPGNPGTRLTLRALDVGGGALGIEALHLEIRNAADFEKVFQLAAMAGVGAVLVPDDPLSVNERTRIAELALKHRLPAVAGHTQIAEAGVMMAYGPNRIDLYRRAAGFVDKILKGGKPADLPIEQPTKLELVINLKTAKALGLTIPPSLLLRADRVIE
jgi:putative tryptophan/tyrosine transport system substrate-binding protein